MGRKDPSELENNHNDYDLGIPPEKSNYDTNENTDNNSHGVIVENNPNGTTKKIKVDLEIDTTTKDIGTNPYLKWVHLARTVDSWRPFPRLFIGIYLYILYRVVEWYLALPDPTMEQSGMVSVIVGAGAAWFGLYISGKARGD